MTIVPRNRFLLVGRCKDPRKQGLIVADAGQPLNFGVVNAVDPGRGDSAVSVGDIVFFPPNTALPIIADNNQGMVLVNEASVVASVSDVKVERLDMNLGPDKIVVPVTASSSLMN